ncbi:hypothetical protein [Candidatus Coxiella mudrowiae]|nr:hypothetical protein [Candidatus Coxiella mudrowiae]
MKAENRNEGRKGMQDYILTRRSVLEQLQIVEKQLWRRIIAYFFLIPIVL